MRGQDFHINIIGLSQKAHEFEFGIDDKFFERYGQQVLSQGRFMAKVTLDKRETMIEARFHIDGEANLVCDRSLEPFSLPMHIDKTIVFKYGAEPQEVSEEMVIITREQQQLDVGQYIYELISVEVPMKRLHPRFQNDAQEESTVQLVYSSPTDQATEESVDPRWEKLKKLK